MIAFIKLDATFLAWDMMLSAGRDRFVRVGARAQYSRRGETRRARQFQVWNWFEWSTEVRSE